MVLLDLPNLSQPQVIKNISSPGEGVWIDGDKMGDGHIIIAGGDYHIAFRCFTGGQAVAGGVYNRKKHDGDIYNGWDAINLADPVRAFPLGLDPTNVAMDTYGLIRNPDTGLLTVHFTTRPGTRPGGELGTINSIQRRTAATPTKAAASWTDYAAEHILEVTEDWEWYTTGGEPLTNVKGVMEQSIVGPIDNDYLMFYIGKNSETDPAGPHPYDYTLDVFGEGAKARLGRAVAPAATFDASPDFTKDPAGAGLGQESTNWVFNQPKDGGIKVVGQEIPGYGTTNENAVWGSANTVIQTNVSVNPSDGVLHMVGLGKKPNTGGGPANKTIGIGHWYSLDGGFTWIPDKKNPLIDIATMGWDPDNGFANKFNSPHMVWDPGKNRAYIAFWGNDVGNGEVGTRIYAASFAPSDGDRSAGGGRGTGSRGAFSGKSSGVRGVPGRPCVFPSKRC